MRWTLSGKRRRVIVRALLVVLVAWLPLLVFSLVQGMAFGTQIKIPFLRDFAVNVRFLVALPILILSESGIDHTWRILVLQFLRSRLVDEKEIPSFEAAIEKTTRLRDHVLPEAVILVLAFVPSLIVRTELLMNGVTNWHIPHIGSNEASLAGWWFNIVSMPIFRLLLLRWIWRMFVWTLFLCQVTGVVFDSDRTELSQVLRVDQIGRQVKVIAVPIDAALYGKSRTKVF